MKQFETLIKALNKAQLSAVTTIEGPVLVVAGPGTGKTQLLGMRAANIVKSTDTAPNNILCLTFTDSAAAAMQARLVEIMGSEGNKIAVHTFHSFGSEIINQHPEFFYNGARFMPADEISSFEVLHQIFEKLPANNPLAKTLNDNFSALPDVKTAISHLKRAGLNPDELLQILQANKKFCDLAEPLITSFFQSKRLGKNDLPKLETLAQQLAQQAFPKEQLFGFKSLGEICLRELSTALEQAALNNKTTPITAWRNAWLEKDYNGQLVLKERRRQKKLRALVDIYRQYRQKLTEVQLFDFDDMVSNVAHTLESNATLRFALQEQYQYIMVDEFQDTNGAQLRLLEALADNPVNEEQPNILAVGDDDQAIYSFQGAELNNILDFTSRWRNVKVITLKDNYRSTKQILLGARKVITQGQNRLETLLENIDKNLTPHNHNPSVVEHHTFKTAPAELEWVAQSIKQQVAAGVSPNQIAVLGRNHKHLLELLPYVKNAGLLVNYERRDNVLEQPAIIELITLAEVVVYLSEQRFDLVESLLPELLSYDFWQINTFDLWNLSLEAYRQNRMWLEIMIESQSQLHKIAEFIIVASHKARHSSVDEMLDILIGTNEAQVPQSESDEISPVNLSEDYISPYRAHYFNAERLKNQPNQYLKLLSNLQALRRVVQNYRSEQNIKLPDLIELIDLHQRTKIPITDTQNALEDRITLMTAHKAKGLEFDSVYIINCQDEIWGRKARRPSSQLSLPNNLPIAPAGNSYDDALRLFFVAMTRAKHNLYLSNHSVNSSGKLTSSAEFLQQNDLANNQHDDLPITTLDRLSPGWQNRWINLNNDSQNELLKPILQNYKLSATHLNNFVDITRGGPQAFLLQNLLRFPQAMTPAQIFGHAIHAVLQRAHTHLLATNERRPLEDILYDFELQLQKSRLSEYQFEQMLDKGSRTLQAYLKENYDSFNITQKAEVSFYGQNVVLENSRLTGAIDLMEVDVANKKIVVKDYKTGKPHVSWQGKSEYDKIKLHKYKQQLMFYKLLVENSRDFSGYSVEKGVLEFVEPDDDGKLASLELGFNNQELNQFKSLISGVWQKIMQLDFADTSHYPPTLKGLLEFEATLTNR